MHLPLAKCIGMIFACVDQQTRGQGVPQPTIDQFIDELVKGGKAYLADHRGKQRLGGAN